MTDKTIPEQAGSLYDACYEAIVVKSNGDRWDVYDGSDGPYVATVDTAVLIEVDDTYDMPVQMVDGTDWYSLYAT